MRKPLTSNSKADGRFDKRDFAYDAASDEYRCLAGERAVWRFSRVEDDMTLHKYWSSACPKCPMRNACTTANTGALADGSTNTCSIRCTLGSMPIRRR